MLLVAGVAATAAGAADADSAQAAAGAVVQATPHQVVHGGSQITRKQINNQSGQTIVIQQKSS